MNVTLRPAGLADAGPIAKLVAEYHAFEGIHTTDTERSLAIAPLLRGDDVGRIWLVELHGEVVGYAAICFGYSIEFGGRDAFIDELYVREQYRGKGIGHLVLEGVAQAAAKALGVRALHLEVAGTNERAQRLYREAGFQPRKHFLMSRSLESGGPTSGSSRRASLRSARG